MKIGLYFGSFNPIHIGHLIVAEAMSSIIDLNKVWFVVSPQNPYKNRKDLLHEFDRLDLVEKAIYDNSKLNTCDIEFALPRPSYTIDTLTQLKLKYPQHEFCLLLGEDNLLHFNKWKNWQQIIDNYTLYIYPRPNAQISALHQDKRLIWIPAPMIDISATFIRKSIQSGRSVRYLLPYEVERYIIEKKFYL